MKLAAAALVALCLPQSGAPRHSIEVERRDGETYCTLLADNAPARDVLADLARRAELTLDGFDPSWETTLVSVDLRGRPLRQTLDYVAGSVGIEAEVRQGAIYLHPALEQSQDREALYGAALAAYLGALRTFPEHELAPEAARSMAIIEERRGNFATARAHYEQLVERHPDSPIVPDSLYRIGQLFQQDAAFSEAIDTFSELLRSKNPHDYEARARLELGWCVAQTGQFERALYMIDALDAIEPPSSRADELRRKQVRIRCLAGLGQGRRALELLDQVEADLVTPADKRESLELRAVSCESAGLLPEAARAWLACAQLVEGAAKQRPLSESARLALASGDELGALFVTKAARAAGFELSTFEHTARVGLKLDDANVGRDSALDRLERAEALVAGGMNKEAIVALRSLQQKPAGLDDAARGRLALTLGRALYAEYGIDLALSHFRAELEVLTDAGQRRAVYVLAGELLEDAGRIDEAIEAYRGRI